MGKERELPTYTLLNPGFHTLEDLSGNVDYSQEKREEIANQDENYQEKLK